MGWEALAFSEVDPFASAVLAHHYPTVPNVGDMTAHDWSAYRGNCDVVVAGTPCQAFSVAGRRESLADERGNLTLRFVEAIDQIDPAFVVWENVPGILSSKDNAFGCFLGAVAGCDTPIVPPRGRKWTGAGMVAGPRRSVVWRVLDARFYGVPQRRRRVFVVAGRAGARPHPAEILFEFGGLHGNPPAGREAGEEVSGTLGGGSGSRGWNNSPDTAGAFVVAAEVAGTITGSTGYGGPDENDAARGMYVVSPAVTGGAPFARTGNERVECEALIANAVLSNAGKTINPENSKGNVVVCPILEVGKRTGKSTDDPRAGMGIGGDGDPMFTLQAGAKHGVATAIGTNSNASGRNTAKVLSQGVRRLTPRECERLQGLPDDYTRVPWRGKPATDSPDGPRYKAIGNGMAVPCVGWILKRIAAVAEAPA